MTVQPTNTTAGKNVLDALDLPPVLHQLQNDYWDARAEWDRLDGAYQLVAADLLKRYEAFLPVPRAART